MGILNETQTCDCENKFVPSAGPIDLDIALPCRGPRACFLSEPNWTLHDYSLPLNKTIKRVETVCFQLKQMELLLCSLECRSSSWTHRSSALKQAHCHGFKPPLWIRWGRSVFAGQHTAMLCCSPTPPRRPAQYGGPMHWWALVQHGCKSKTQPW